MVPVFENEVKKLQGVKQGVYETVDKVQVTPAIAEMMRHFAFFLDTAYLWLSQLGAVVAEADEAVAPEPNTVQFPGPEQK